MKSKKNHLLDFDRRRWQQWFADLGEKPFRSTQVMKWLYHDNITNVEAMHNLSRSLRGKLSELTEFTLPKIVREQRSSDGVRKWVLQYDCGNSIESVYIPEENRATLCVSSQAGCSLKCPFCSTAQGGFNRNLNCSEIIAQLWLAKQQLHANETPITNVVLMGMGEPLLNFNAVVSATAIMTDDYGFGLSRRRVTISTSGIVPAIDKLAEVSDVSLAVSLHAPNDKLRNEIVPINQRYGLHSLLQSCQRYVQKNAQHGGIIWEYVMLDGVNDSAEHARELANLLADVRGKINLIPFNSFQGSKFRCSPRARILQFQRHLNTCGYVTTIRKTRGANIDGACGQLVGTIENRLQRLNVTTRQKSPLLTTNGAKV